MSNYNINIKNTTESYGFFTYTLIDPKITNYQDYLLNRNFSHVSVFPKLLSGNISVSGTVDEVGDINTNNTFNSSSGIFTLLPDTLYKLESTIQTTVQLFWQYLSDDGWKDISYRVPPISGLVINNCLFKTPPDKMCQVRIGCIQTTLNSYIGGYGNSFTNIYAIG